MIASGSTVVPFCRRNWIFVHAVAPLSVVIWGTFAITGHTLSRHNAIPRPEDRKDAEVVDGAGAIGFFPPSSLVPFWTTCAVALIGLGPVFGWWISLIGVAFGIWCVFGWAYEFYRGDFKH